MIPEPGEIEAATRAALDHHAATTEPGFRALCAVMAIRLAHAYDAWDGADVATGVRLNAELLRTVSAACGEADPWAGAEAEHLSTPVGPDDGA